MFPTLIAGMLLLAPIGTAADVQALQKMREGERLMSEDEFASAAEAFQDAIALDPLLVLAHYRLGTARMALKEYDAAVAAFEGARSAFDDPAAWNATRRAKLDAARAARILELEDRMRNAAIGSRGRGMTDAARQQWREEIETLKSLREAGGRPTRLPAGLSLALGSAYFRTGLLAAAEREYRAAIAAQPKLGEARSNLAVVLLITGRVAEARDEADRAEKAGFRLPAGLSADIDAAVADTDKH